MSNYEEAAKMLRALSDKPYTIPKQYVNFMGGLEGGLFLNQVIFWSDKGSDREWFYKTYEEWEKETTLSEYKVRRYSKELVDQGFLETKVKKANGNPTVHYHFCFENFSKAFLKFLENVPQEIRETLTDEYTDDNSILKTREVSQDSEFENLSPDNRAFWENRERERKERQSPQMRLPRTSEDVRSEAEQAIMGYYNNRDKNHAFVLENKIDLSFVPEELLPLAQATCVILKRGPTKQEQAFWIKAWRNQLEMGLTPDDLEGAAERMSEDQLLIKSPMSLDAVAWDVHANGLEQAPTKPRFSQQAMEFMRQQQQAGGE